MDFCLEKSVYDRQVNKEGMSSRVIDESNPDAYLSLREASSLFWESKHSEIVEICKDKYVDVVMKKLIEKCSELFSREPFKHDVLLKDRKENALSTPQKLRVLEDYELNKRAHEHNVNRPVKPVSNCNYQQTHIFSVTQFQFKQVNSVKRKMIGGQVGIGAIEVCKKKKVKLTKIQK